MDKPIGQTHSRYDNSAIKDFIIGKEIKTIKE